MRKYTVIVAAAALLLAFEGAGLSKTAPKAAAPADQYESQRRLKPTEAPAPTPVVKCTNPDAFAAEHPIIPFTSLTGEALRQYIDAFNEVGGGHQGYDDFDRLDVYHPRPDASVWVFFKGGCMNHAPTPATEMHEKIMERLHGRGA